MKMIILSMIFCACLMAGCRDNPPQAKPVLNQDCKAVGESPPEPVEFGIKVAKDFKFGDECCVKNGHLTLRSLTIVGDRSYPRIDIKATNGKDAVAGIWLSTSDKCVLGLIASKNNSQPYICFYDLEKKKYPYAIVIDEGNGELSLQMVDKDNNIKFYKIADILPKE